MRPLYAVFFMTEYILAIIVIITLVLSYLERRDLTNKLMAKDLTDLTVNTEKPEKNQESPKDETIPLEEAQEELENDLEGVYNG